MISPINSEKLSTESFIEKAAKVVSDRKQNLFIKVMGENVRPESEMRKLLAEVLNFESFLDYSKLSRAQKCY